MNTIDTISHIQGKMSEIHRKATVSKTVTHHIKSKMSGIERSIDKVDNKEESGCDSGKGVDRWHRRLRVCLPCYEYSKMRFAHVPLDSVRTNGLRFDKLDDALLYIRNHCVFHFGKFNLNLARYYIKYCSIYDAYSDIYVTQERLDAKELKRAFSKIEFY